MALSGLVACRCDTGIGAVPGDLRAPAELDLGMVPVGQALVRGVTLENRARAPVRVNVWARGPFALAGSATAQIPAGANEVVEVRFAPMTLGAVSGALVIDLESGGAVETRLLGNGVAACTSPRSCRVSTFDFSEQRCIDSNAPEGAACTDSCVSEGQCHEGICLGRFAGCDDGNPCTDDYCSAADECLHLPHQCPVVNDVCSVSYCDAATGCTARPLDDGVSCGRAECLTAEVCIAGRCVERATPVPPGECTYSSVCVGNGYSCAATLSGRLRCWGKADAIDATAGPEEIRAPRRVPGAINVREPVCPERMPPMWLDAAGRLQPGDVFADAGVVEIRRTSRSVTPGLSVVDAAGQLALVGDLGVCVVRDAGITDVSVHGHVSLADGGSGHVDAICQFSPSSGRAPSRWLTALGSFTSHGWFEDAGSAFFPAGAATVGNLGRTLCNFSAGRSSAETPSPPSPSTRSPGQARSRSRPATPARRCARSMTAVG